MQFKEYKTDTNTDGSVNIRGLEIFKLCKRGAKTFDEKWFKKALNYHAAEKVDEYLPPAFIGHEETEGKETEVVGFLDNLKLNDNVVNADVLKVPAAMFKKMKERKFPNRSVELVKTTGQIAGLAFLGKTRPFHKLPIMEFRDQELETDVVDFDESVFGTDHSSGSWNDKLFERIEKTFSKVLTDMFFSKKMDVLKNEQKFEDDMTPEQIEKMKADITAELTTKFQADEKERFDTMYVDRFKKETGHTPDNFQEENKKAQKDRFNESKKSVLDKAAKLNIAPAIIDGYIAPLIDAFAEDGETTMKFADKDEGSIFQLMDKFAESLAKRVEDNTLIVDMDERARGGEDDGNPNFKGEKVSYLNMSGSDRVELDRKVAKFMKDNKIETFEEALDQYLEENNL